MSNKNWKHNYTNYSKPMETTNEELKKVEETVDEDTYVEPEEGTGIEEAPEVQPKEEAIGFVDGTAKLYVRTEPNKDSKPVTIIDRLTEVVIDLEESTDEWYSVEVDGLHGFCMKKYIRPRK